MVIVDHYSRIVTMCKPLKAGSARLIKVKLYRQYVDRLIFDNLSSMQASILFILLHQYQNIHLTLVTDIK